MPALRSDVIDPDYFAVTRPHAPPRTGYDGPVAWLGPAGTIAQLHWDPEHNFFVQVRGRKRIILIPPQEAPLTYPNTFTVADLATKPFFQEKGAPALKALEAITDKVSNAGQKPSVDAYRRAWRARRFRR